MPNRYDWLGVFVALLSLGALWAGSYFNHYMEAGHATDSMLEWWDIPLLLTTLGGAGLLFMMAGGIWNCSDELEAKRLKRRAEEKGLPPPEPPVKKVSVLEANPFPPGSTAWMDYQYGCQRHDLATRAEVDEVRRAHVRRREGRHGL